MCVQRKKRVMVSKTGQSRSFFREMILKDAFDRVRMGKCILSRGNIECNSLPLGKARENSKVQ